MFCSKCGTKLNENAKFCQECGEKVIENEDAITGEVVSKKDVDNTPKKDS